jgi:hypothetical protein
MYVMEKILNMERMTIKSAYSIRCFSPVQGRCLQFPKPSVGPHVYKFSNFHHQSDSATKERKEKRCSLWPGIAFKLVHM